MGTQKIHVNKWLTVESRCRINMTQIHQHYLLDIRYRNKARPAVLISDCPPLLFVLTHQRQHFSRLERQIIRILQMTEESDTAPSFDTFTISHNSSPKKLSNNREFYEITAMKQTIADISKNYNQPL